MATTPTDLPATLFSPVATTVPGQPVSQVLTLTPTLAAPSPNSVNFFAATVQQAIASDIAANTAGNTSLPPPNNFAFTDLTVNVSSVTPGDVFKGSTPGITSQFLDLTPDNVLIQATGPNTFMKSDNGNDLLIAASGRNILSAGSGADTMLSGPGQDTFLSDASKASASSNILNFGVGDDAALLGVNLTDFKFSIKDTIGGLEIDATATNPGSLIAGQMTLQGVAVADIGTKLTLGLGSTADGKSFLFVHHN